MNSFICEICKKPFAAKESLDQHNIAKHSVLYPKPDTNNNAGKIRKWRRWAIGIIIIISLFSLAGWGIASFLKERNLCQTAPASGTNIGSHQNINLHKHVELEIIIDGKKQLIPSNIGVLPGIMRPLHTHDDSGEVHIEGLCVRSFELGEFFDVWGREFNEQCIFDSCSVDNKGILIFYVNGIENNQFDSYLMQDKDKIKIEYTSL